MKFFHEKTKLQKLRARRQAWPDHPGMGIVRQFTRRPAPGVCFWRFIRQAGCGRVWNRVGAVYPRKKRIKLAKRPATNARSSAGRPQFKPGLNCAVGLSQKRGASRVGLSPTHVSHPRSQTGPALAACCPCREPVMTEGSCVIISAHQWPNVWLWPTGPAVLRSSIC